MEDTVVLHEVIRAVGPTGSWSDAQFQRVWQLAASRTAGRVEPDGWLRERVNGPNEAHELVGLWLQERWTFGLDAYCREIARGVWEVGVGPGRQAEATRPLLVGESNPHSDHPRHALLPRPRHAAGARLAAHLGMSEVAYLRAFDRINLSRYPFDPAQAEASAALMRLRWPERPMVLLGRRVARAFGFREFPAWCAFGPSILVPHPSGRCREWNDPWTTDMLQALVLPLVGQSKTREEGR